MKRFSRINDVKMWTHNKRMHTRRCAQEVENLDKKDETVAEWGQVLDLHPCMQVDFLHTFKTWKKHNACSEK